MNSLASNAVLCMYTVLLPVIRSFNYKEVNSEFNQLGEGWYRNKILQQQY